MSLPRYSAYKATGTELMEIPAHWQLVRARSLGQFSSSGIDKKAVEGEQFVRMFNYLDVYRSKDKVLTYSDALMATTAVIDKAIEHAVRAGDILLTPSSETPGDIGHAARVAEMPDGVVYSYHLVRYRPLVDVDAAYLVYLLNSAPTRRYFASVCTGTTRQVLVREDLKNTPVCLPPLPEQRSIAVFLDRETAKIDALIAEQEKLLALLAEKRQATISHAVTRGLDPNAPMKDAGIPWLGEVPAHWETVRLRHLARLNPSKTEVEEDGDPDISFLPMEAIGEDGSIRVDQERPLSQLQNGYSYFRNGDVVVAKITPCFENGKGALISDLPRGYGFGTTELIVVRSVGCVRPAFLSLVLSSSLFRKLAEGAMYGAGGQKRVPDEFVREFTVCVPPVEEQDAIWEEVAKQTGLLRSLELQSISAIALLRERRSALIAAAVTGQIDVRGAVAAVEAA